MFFQHAKVDLPRDCRHISCGVRWVFFFFFFQLAQAWQEVEVAKSRAQQLQDEVEELQEKVQVAGNHGDVSLLSELEVSLEAADLGVSKEEVSGSLVRVFLTSDREQI